MVPHNNPETESLLANNDRETDGEFSAAQTARMAFESSNVEASRQYHDSRVFGNNHGTSQENWHQGEGGLLKPIIFGGLDGCLTAFALVSGAAGGQLPPAVVLILGFSNIFADALRYVRRQFFILCLWLVEKRWYLCDGRA